jgi:hypothetical protein
MKIKKVFFIVIAIIAIIFGIIMTLGTLVGSDENSKYSMSQNLLGVLFMGILPILQAIFTIAFREKLAKNFFKTILGNLILFCSAFVFFDALLDISKGVAKVGLNGMQFESSSHTLQAIISGLIALVGCFILWISVKKPDAIENPLAEYENQMK